MENGKILIVEDERILAKDLESSLRKVGYSVVGIAATGDEALAAVRAEAPDAVLMDIKLRGEMDGVQTAEHIKGEFDVPIVYLTAHCDDETLERAKGTAPYGYLVKPLNEQLLLITLEMALAKHQSEKKIGEAMKKLELANRKAESQKRFFEALFNSIPAPVLVVDGQNRVRAANPLVEEVFSLAPEEVLGRLTGDALGCACTFEPGVTCGASDCAETCPVRRSTLDSWRNKPARRVKADFRTGLSGTARDFHLLISASPVELDGESLSILILEDVTELSRLRRIVKSTHSYCGIVGTGERMQEVFSTIREVAGSTVSVLIQGESGTGKELVALAIHSEGDRSRKHFVAVNCGALPDGLLESELFGHVKGAFTGAIRDKKGRFELAHEGTLFLDEIGELSMPMQVKLLRVLQSGTFERVGGEQTIKVDVRLLAATNKDLEKEVAAGRFRADLYYRLCVMPILLPPLRERREDIPLLAEHLLLRITRDRGIADAALSLEALGVLMDQPWPGNVRELENALQFALLKSKGGEIRPEHLPPSLQAGRTRPPATPRRQKKLRALAVEEAVRAAGGNKVKAAQILGVGRATLYRFLDENPLSEAGT